MKGWILTSGHLAPEIERTIAEAKTSGIELTQVNPREVDLFVDANTDSVRIGDTAWPIPDFAIAAFFEEFDYYSIQVLRNLETLGTLCLNRASVIENSYDKLRSHLLVTRAGIPAPKTLLLHRGMTMETVLQYLTLPLILKPVNGSKGEGVKWIRDHAQLRQKLKELHAPENTHEWIAQEYIKSSHGRDLRVLVIDHKPVAAMQREGASGKLQSNYSLGGNVSRWEIDEKLHALSGKVIQATGLNMGGIDFLLNDDDYLFCEINSMPGFQGLEKCTKMNVPVAIFQSIGRQLSQRTKSRFQMRSFLRSEPAASSIVLGLNQTHPVDILPYFLGLCEQPKTTQDQVLFDILKRNQNTTKGRQLEFNHCTNMQSFRNQVPISSWGDYAEDARAMESGATDVMFAGETDHFIITSGTTGEPKHLPESVLGAMAKNVTGRIRTAAIGRQHPTLMEGAILPLSNRPSFGRTESGIPIGSASGLTLAAVPPSIKNRIAFPLECFSILDQETLDLVMLCFALAQDVRTIIGNNAARAQQIFEKAKLVANDILASIENGKLPPDLPLDQNLRKQIESNLQADPQRADFLRNLQKENRFLPRFYWPELSVFSCWLSGSVGRFKDALRPYLPEDCRMFDCGYGASEGKFNIPLTPEQASGALAIHAAFYEFLPVDGGETLLAHELEDKERYEMIITTYSGLYRYNLHDIIQVDGFTGNTPNIVFETKSGEIANIAGEKLTPLTIIEALESLPEDLRKQIRHYSLLEGQSDHHWLCIEPVSASMIDMERILDRFNKALVRVSLIYKVFWDQGLLKDCQGIQMKPGWQDTLYAKRDKGSHGKAQIKLPVILRETLDEEHIDSYHGMPPQAS